MENLEFLNFDIWVIVKIFTLIILGMYIFFAFVIRRQVKVMTDTLQLGFESLARFLSFVHLVFAILVFVTALIVL
ncbi:MAG: hypothetical protein ACD_13C00149G0015 [uncultured bacterium]|nr:MAG: hypothetical protein ACD_13C00149G0015 [uncultured bacterium]